MNRLLDVWDLVGPKTSLVSSKYEIISGPKTVLEIAHEIMFHWMLMRDLLVGHDSSTNHCPSNSANSPVQNTRLYHSFRALHPTLKTRRNLPMQIEIHAKCLATMPY
jgi:hypothetical protein